MMSQCRFLFNKEAEELYNPSVVTDEFVNQSLEVLMRVNAIFLSRQENDGFGLLDPAAGNNQCHLYAYMSGLLRSGYKTKTEDEKRAQTPENRYLHLAFILSHTFIIDRTLLCSVIDKLVQREGISHPLPKKKFYHFVKDGLPDHHGLLIRTARVAFNVVFEGCIKELLASKSSLTSLHRELSVLSYAELRLAEGGYTYPKFAGVLSLVLENISYVFKVKIVTQQGTGLLVYSTGAQAPDSPVLTFEGVASETHSMEQIRSIAQRCPHFFWRKPSSKQRHPEGESCPFCMKTQTDPTQYEARFRRSMRDLPHTLLALGADFMLQEQASFAELLQNDDKYSCIAELFQHALASVEERGLGRARPITFTVFHVYVDSLENVLESEPRICMSPDAFLKKRGYL